MPYANVPQPHLQHLINGLFQDPHRGRLFELSRSSAEEDRRQLIDTIEEARAGTFDELTTAYRHFGVEARHVVHIWRLPCLDNLAADALVERVARQTGATLPGGHVFPRVGDDDVRLAKVWAGDGAVRAQVNLRKQGRREYEDDVSTYPYSQKVHVVVPYATPRRIEVYANYADAMIALKFTMSEVFGVGLHADTKRWGLDVIRHRPATVDHAQRLYRELDGHYCDVQSDDPEGTLRFVHFGSQPNGQTFEPLDLDDARIAAAMRQEPHGRDIVLQIPHPDGYVEEGMVRFTLKSQKPHLKFARIVSRHFVATVLSGM